MSKQEATRLAEVALTAAETFGDTFGWNGRDPADFERAWAAHRQRKVEAIAAALLRQSPDGEPVGPIYCVGNKVSHAYFWRRSDAEAFAATAAPSVGLHVWEVPVMGKSPESPSVPSRS